ncbi:MULTISPECIES: YggS family pyridoxal phosphate-dependent enzyme [unclassified Minwuia]|jgi:PLP dependent protein|uniref:YggS family pyridoxal phosphate-dependent enzyme n=1 Tax=unclassified Minwuia TaxID=2618799 RepID=UPI002479C9A0|nr:MULTISPECIES: YggS family pyridoxal phosphate-dependent enzyme [unclassified Minwuia]
MTEPAEHDIARALQEVRDRIDAAARDAGRDPAEVSLIAVSKTHPADHIRPAIDAGQRIFGENRVQEAEDKWPTLKADFPETELHMIGGLQSRKVAPAVALFDVIHSIDREKVAAAAARAMAELGRRPACFIQVNTGEEPQKSGVVPADADAFIERCRAVHDLPLAGLMCIPPADQEPAPHFALLAKIAERNGLRGLSMGMSADYEVAIQFGATLVRVGTAIFGHRAPIV